jgi:4-amino-4-deoxy-L-arabinose transferase-like glycosyltransferase
MVHTPWRAVLVLLAASAVLFFYGLADRDLWSSHEARAAQDASSILEEGRWGLPQLYDRHAELQKPPLYYWLVAGIGWWRGGVDAWAVRLPAAISATLIVLTVYFLCHARGRSGAGLAAALMLATSLHFTWLARVGRIDMPLTLATTLSLVGFYLCMPGRPSEPSTAAFAKLAAKPLGYIAAGAAVLLKGPIGLLLPAATLAAFLAFEVGFRSAIRPRTWLRWAGDYGLWWGAPLVALIVLPWFIWANGETDGQLWSVFFVKHNLERGLGGGTLTAHPWWFYGPRLLADALPWSVVLVPAIFLFFRRGWWPEDREARFGLIWLGATMVLLSLSRFKRADYLLPAYPGVAIFLGCVRQRWGTTYSLGKVTAVAFATAITGCLVGWIGFLNFSVTGQDARLEWRSFAQEIRHRAPAPQLIIFFRAEAHALAFHVGRPVDTILEWENLDVWAGRPEIYYVVMPPDCAAEWSRHLSHGRLVEVLRSSGLGENDQPHPLVLLRTCHDPPQPPSG